MKELFVGLCSVCVHLGAVSLAVWFGFFYTGFPESFVQFLLSVLITGFVWIPASMILGVVFAAIAAPFMD